MNIYLIKRILPWLAALAALMVALLVRWPDSVFSSDQNVDERLPGRRAVVQQAMEAFQPVHREYREYVHSHDLASLLVNIKDSLRVARESPGDAGAAARIAMVAEEVLPFSDVLYRYIDAGEEYITATKRLDDDLMSWTRSLGFSVELLRKDTFPVVGTFKRYPVPLGEYTDPPYKGAKDVEAYATRLREAITALKDPGTTVEKRTLRLDELDKAVADVWESGRSIEYINSIHEEYRYALVHYEKAVERAVEANKQASAFSIPGLATNLAVGALLLVGLGLLFGGAWRKGPSI